VRVNDFKTTDTVKMWWDPYPDDGTVDITVVYEGVAGDASVASWNDVPSAQSGLLSFVANLPGFYDITFEGVHSGRFRVIGESSIFAAPISVLGTSMAVTVGFAAFGSICLAKHSKTKKLTV
jgi:hypothetical protein